MENITIIVEKKIHLISYLEVLEFGGNLHAYGQKFVKATCQGITVTIQPH